MSEKDEKAEPAKKIFKVDLKITDQHAGGEYSNIFVVNHNDSEFVMDSFFFQPGRPDAIMKGRVIMSPRGAKRLLSLLADNIKRYEEHFGEIKLDAGGPSITMMH